MTLMTHDDTVINQQGLRVLVYQRVFRGLWVLRPPKLVFHVHPLDGGNGRESHLQMSKVVSHVSLFCWHLLAKVSR